MPNNDRIIIIGGGLAGSEAALQLAKRKIYVTLYEMRPGKNTPAHETGFMGELLCSNSLKAETIDTSSGLLKTELEKMDCILLNIAKKHRVPAGGALAVNRNDFAKEIDQIIESNEYIEVIREEVTEVPLNKNVIITSGPLTSDALSANIKTLVGNELHFFDAIAPIIEADSLDFDKCFFKGRYDRGGDDYVNCPMSQDEYYVFYDALMAADKVEFKEFEKMAVFEGCMPVEEMASRGRETLSFGPLKPVGLEHPETGERFYAVVQLRKENVEGTAFNMVGFQTKMKIGEQKRVFRMIPGLENAEFLRFGSVHRNTYINAPSFLKENFNFKRNENIYFAGQITGVEGYVESIASGLLAALHLSRKLTAKEPLIFPIETALSSLGRHVSFNDKKKYSPSNFHFGMLPPLDGKKIRERKKKRLAHSARALRELENFIEKNKLG